MTHRWPRIFLPVFLALLLVALTGVALAGRALQAPAATFQEPLAAAPTSSTLIAGDVFTDVSAAVGVTAVHTQALGYYGTGQAWGDYDGDGWLDLYLTNNVGPNTLYRNLGGTFVVSPLSASLALTDSISGGALFTDYDNDGWTDLYVLNKGANVLYRNDGGAGFTDVTATAGVGDTGTGETGAWGDFDQDGHLDLYVTNWACDECDNGNYEGNRDRLYRSNGDGTFSDITASLGVTQTLGAGFVASFVDYDNDADLDIYLVNDRMKGPNVNILWRNDGSGCGSWCFADVSESSGANINVAGMGLAILDYDHDGDLDFYFSNVGPAVLLQNQTSQGNPTFIDVADTAGVGKSAISWGAVALDYDNDALIDLYLAIDDGYPGTDNFLAQNQGSGKFSEVSNAGGAVSLGKTNGVAYADYDNDGWLDLVIGNRQRGYQLYRNEAGAASMANWVRVALTGAGAMNRDAIGSRVTLYSDDGSVQTMELKSGSSLGAGNELRLHFGLNSAEPVSATIRWPNGEEIVYYDIPINDTWAVTYTPPAFSDVTAAAGVATPHHADSYTYMSVGQAWGDYNGDGYLDLYVTDQYGPNTLYTNDGDGTFTPSPLNATVALTDTQSGGALFGDFNNDGWADLYVLNWGDNVLFRNDGGGGFTDVTATAGVGDSGTGETAAWGDFDNDGLLDLYVTNWDCPSGCDIVPDKLYHNQGDGTFVDVSSAMTETQRIKPGFVASFVDYDNDNDLDIYVINDFETGNVLWRNDGPGCTHWCFTDVSAAANADTGVYGMGLAIGDYDLDGDLDFYFSDADPAVLLQNQTSQGSPTFVDVSVAAGVDYDAPLTVSWATFFIDYDNNGWPDLYLATMNTVGIAPNRLFHNQMDGTFADRSDGNGANNTGESLGAAYADYDNDGRLDIVVGNMGDGYSLYRNTSEDAASNDWLSIMPVGSGPVNRDGVGTRVTLDLDDGRSLMQEVKNGSSLGAGNQRALHFGLGDSTVLTATVRWPNGVEQQFVSPPVNQTWDIAYPTLGDVSGNDALDVIDALFVLQYDVELRTGTTLFPPPDGMLYRPNCDVDGNDTCDVIDALFILQCDVGLTNVLCE